MIHASVMKGGEVVEWQARARRVLCSGEGGGFAGARGVAEVGWRGRQRRRGLQPSAIAAIASAPHAVLATPTSLPVTPQKRRPRGWASCRSGTTTAPPCTSQRGAATRRCPQKEASTRRTPSAAVRFLAGRRRSAAVLPPATLPAAAARAPACKAAAAGSAEGRWSHSLPHCWSTCAAAPAHPLCWPAAQVTTPDQKVLIFGGHYMDLQWVRLLFPPSFSSPGPAVGACLPACLQGGAAAGLASRSPAACRPRGGAPAYAGPPKPPLPALFTFSCLPLHK